MNAQLAALIGRIEAASLRAAQMREKNAMERLVKKPDPARWSAVECIAHLNITASKMYPPLEEGLEKVGTLPGKHGEQLRMDLIGRLLNWSLRPGSAMKMNTPSSFVPGTTSDPDEIFERFQKYQADLSALIMRADGMKLDSVKITSAFNERVRYNLFSAINIIVTHVERHLLQAENALK